MRRACAVYDHTLGHLGEIPNNVVMRRFEVDAMAGSTYVLRRMGRTAEVRTRLNAAFERRDRQWIPTELTREAADATCPGRERHEIRRRP